MNDDESDDQASSLLSAKAVIHAKIFYGQIGFTLITGIFGARLLIYRHIPFFEWLPALFLLLDATLSLASLLYLDFSRHNTISYFRLVIPLLFLRLICITALFTELFLPHSTPFLSIPIIIIGILHGFFTLLAAVEVNNLTNIFRQKILENGLRMNVQNGSTTTLVTNVDDDFEHF